MDRKSFQRIEMFTRVVEFGAAHTDLFPKNTFAGQAFAALGTALSSVSDSAGAQFSSRNTIRSSARVRDAACEALRKQLQQISDTAAAIAIDTPGIEGKFQMPVKQRAQALIQAGKAFAPDAEPIKKAFVQHLMPADFLDRLNTAVGDLEAATAEHATGKIRRANADASIREGLAECQRLLTRVETVVANTVGDNAAITAEWETLRHVAKGPTRPHSIPAPSPEPNPTPAT